MSNPGFQFRFLTVGLVSLSAMAVVATRSPEPQVLGLYPQPWAPWLGRAILDSRQLAAVLSYLGLDGAEQSRTSGFGRSV